MVGTVSLVEAIVTAGASVNVTDGDGNTPLHWASKRGDNGIVAFLLENGADPSVAGDGGTTPLHWACSHGHGATAELLVEAGGANLAAVDETGATPRDLAAAGDNQGCLAVIDRLLSMLVVRYWLIAMMKS